jgi:hypothetical protein
VLLACPNGPVSRQVAWLGRRRVDCARHPKPEAVWPVLIRAGAFGADMPARDLYVSPGHSVFSEGVLIQAEKLVNGATLIQTQCDRVEYWHIELDAHDILLAEGLPTESYLDNGNRSAFEGGGEFLDLHPDFAPKHWTDTCVPLVFDRAVLQQTKTLLLTQAQTLGHQITAEDDLHVIADGRRVNPIHLTAARRAMVVPEGCTEIRLISSTFVPARRNPQSNDERRLGICVGRLQLDGADIALNDDNAFTTGWHGCEGWPGRPDQRWTTCSTELPPNTKLVVIDLAGPGYYWAKGPNVKDNVVALFG